MSTELVLFRNQQDLIKKLADVKVLFLSSDMVTMAIMHVKSCIISSV